jgi:predicted phage tail protein
MLKKVTLYGELAAKYGKDWSLDISSPAEAIRALCANNPGFKGFMASSAERGVGYKVLVGTKELDNVLVELSNPTGRQDIKIVPVIGGAKSGVTTVIIGAIMIYAAVMTAGASTIALASANATAAGATTAAAQLGAVSLGTQFSIGMASLSGMSLMAVKFGAMLVLGGLSSMLSSTPEPPIEAKKAQNYSFNGATNTTRQGVAIPILYGQLMIGGAVISAGVTPEDYTP